MCMLAPESSTNSLSSRFIVDAAGKLHSSVGEKNVVLISKKDLNSAELETVRLSKNQMTVVTANGEVLTKEEATVYVKELDLFVTVMLLKDTLARFALGQLCEDHGYNYHWTSGHKPHLIKNGRKIECNTANYVPFVVHGLSTSSSKLIFTDISYIFIAGSRNFYAASRINKK